MLRICIATLVALTMVACGKSQAEKDAELQRLMEPYYQKRAEEKRAVAKDLSKATDKELMSLLSSCQSAVMALARKDYAPFEPFIVDSYSADALQAKTYVSGGRIQKEDDFTSRLKAFRQNGSPSANSLDTSFSVMVTRDSFSGPERMNKNARCDILPGLKVQAAWS